MFRLVPFVLVMLAFGKESGLRFTRFIVAVFVHFGLSGLGGATGFLTAGWGGKGCKCYKNGDQYALHAVKIGLSGDRGG